MTQMYSAVKAGSPKHASGLPVPAGSIFRCPPSPPPPGATCALQLVTLLRIMSVALASSAPPPGPQNIHEDVGPPRLPGTPSAPQDPPLKHIRGVRSATRGHSPTS